MMDTTITKNPSSPQPLRQQHTNLNINQLLMDTFEKVGKASGAGGLETSKWAMKDGESLSRYRHRSKLGPHHQHQQQQQQPLPQRKQFINSGSRTTGTKYSTKQDSQQQQQQQQQQFSCPHQSEDLDGKNQGGEKEANHGTGEAATSVKATTSTRDRDSTTVLCITDVDIDVDMSSLHALVGQCIDPGLERIVDVWEVGDTCRTVTLHFISISKAQLFSSLLGRLQSWSKYKVYYVATCNS